LRFWADVTTPARAGAAFWHLGSNTYAVRPSPPVEVRTTAESGCAARLERKPRWQADWCRPRCWSTRRSHGWPARSCGATRSASGRLEHRANDDATEVRQRWWPHWPAASYLGEARSTIDSHRRRRASTALRLVAIRRS